MNIVQCAQTKPYRHIAAHFGINRGLGVPAGFYHFAFEAGTVDELKAKREELIGKGVTVTDIVDHEWAQSIYFKDPNGMSLEYCCAVRVIGTEDDVTMQQRVESTSFRKLLRGS